MWYKVLHINDNDVHNKLQRFQHICGTTQHKFKTCNKDILLKSHKTVVVPIFLYGYENLTSQQQHERLTERVETKFLRLFVGHTIFNHKTKEELWQELNINNLNQINVDYRYKWTWQLLRMNDTHIPQLV